jgi:hypothetical protein
MAGYSGRYPNNEEIQYTADNEFIDKAQKAIDDEKKEEAKKPKRTRK